ncbi:uncharacterized protein PpBr36_06769 [Pyricularia pennisetigena]|uniref:uncharacterized protein n=1 Tax=Pyricularia pennisetigena TaxID=1578925 RepID=UPI00115087DE|nr:uncharacterized protein PpBr36_06769 [Pyricularia pennisetigena]TLS23270.1 hypothetical protein PpBr36_06769 [Pyricularia pennisetigena]
MALRFETAEAQASTAASMDKTATGLLRQVLAEKDSLAALAGAICQATQVADLTTALTAAIRRAVHHHKQAEGLAFAIANECVAEVKEQARDAMRAAAQAAVPPVVLGDDVEDETLDLLAAVLEDAFVEEALDLVEKKD